MKYKVILASSVLVFLLVSTITGCTTRTSLISKDIKPNDTMEVELSWWNYSNWDLLDGEPGKYEEQTIIKAFNEIYPNIKVNLTMISFEGGPEKVNVAIASNRTPDVIYDYPGRLIEYAKRGIMANVNDMINMEDFKSDVPESILTACQWEDNYYVYPHNTVGFLMGVNKSIFEDIGALDLLPLEQEDRLWSTEEFTTALERIRDSDLEVYPTAFYCKSTSGDQAARAFIQNLSGSYLTNEEQTVFRINESEGVLGLQWIVDGLDSGLIAPHPETMVSDDAIDLYLQGKAATVIIYSPVLKKIYSDKKRVDFEEVFMPWPTPKGDGSDLRIGPHIGGLGVFDNGDQDKINASKALIDFICNDPSQIKKNIVNSGGFSVRQSRRGYYDDVEMSYAEQLTRYSSKPELLINNYASMREVWFPYIQKAMIQELSPQEALDQFVKEANSIISHVDSPAHEKAPLK